MASLERTNTPHRFRYLIATVPALCGLLGAFIANIPVSLLGGLVPGPLLALVPVYFWCLVRPDLMTPAIALMIGMAEDVLSGGPPGIWSLAFVLTYALIARQRDSFAGLAGLAAVMGFATAAAFTCSVAYLSVAGFALLTPDASLPPIAPILGALAMSVLFYPPSTLAVSWLHHKLVGALRGDV